MDFSYYTFPGILIAITSALYFWQEPRMKSLEKGREKLIQKTVEEIVKHSDIQVTRKAVHNFLMDAYIEHKHLLMPIQKFLPYRRITWCLIAAMVLATICALFQERMIIISIFNNNYFSLSLNAALTTSIVIFCAFPAKWLFEEFRYMKHVISLFDIKDNT